MLKKESFVDKALQHSDVVEQIDINAHNISQTPYSAPKDPVLLAVKALLEEFAKQAATMATDDSPEIPEPSGDWRQKFANATVKRMEAKGIWGVIDSTLAKLGEQDSEIKRRREELGVLFLQRIAESAGQVARMLQLGLDPELLMDDSDEAFLKHLQKLAQDLGGAPIISVRM